MRYLNFFRPKYGIKEFGRETKIIVITWKLMKIHWAEFQNFSILKNLKFHSKKLIFEVCQNKMQVNFANVQVNVYEWVLMLFQWFFYGKKGENSYFSDQKFFTPLTSFLPPFFSWEALTCFKKWRFHHSLDT